MGQILLVVQNGLIQNFQILQPQIQAISRKSDIGSTHIKILEMMLKLQFFIGEGVFLNLFQSAIDRFAHSVQ